MFCSHSEPDSSSGHCLRCDESRVIPSTVPINGKHLGGYLYTATHSARLSFPHMALFLSKNSKSVMCLDVVVLLRGIRDNEQALHRYSNSEEFSCKMLLMLGDITIH